MKWLACAVAFVALTVGSAMAQSVSDEFLVTPGKSIGPIQLGMAIPDVVKILGTPKRTITNLKSMVLSLPEGSTLFDWPPAVVRPNVTGQTGFAVITGKDGMVFEVQSPFDARYHTAEGLHPDSKVQEVTDKLGAPDRQPSAPGALFQVYDRLGLAFVIENDRQYRNYGKVVGIWVFPPK